jgi:hypothetical protein
MAAMRRRLLLALCAAAAAVGTAAAAQSPGPLGPEGVPIPKAPVLAAPADVKPGQTVDGVTCQLSEKVAFHIHSHLTLFVSGRAYQVPYGIGIGQPLQGVRTARGPFVTGGNCFMWLHTHAADGIIHVEAPKLQTFTLGQFFAVWGVKLSRDGVGSHTGKVTAFYNGKPWTRDPSAIPLTAAAQIQLDVGTPVIGPEHITFPSGLAASMTKSK